MIMFCLLVTYQFLTVLFIAEWMEGSDWLSVVIFWVVRLCSLVLKCTSALKTEVIHSSETLVSTVPARLHTKYQPRGPIDFFMLWDYLEFELNLVDNCPEEFRTVSNFQRKLKNLPSSLDIKFTSTNWFEPLAMLEPQTDGDSVDQPASAKSICKCMSKAKPKCKILVLGSKSW
jgi:hypothetical protein